VAKRATFAGMSWHHVPKDDAWKQAHLAMLATLRERAWLHCDGCRHSIMIEPHELTQRHRLDMLPPLLTISNGGALFHDLALHRAIVRAGARVAQQKLLCEPAGFQLRAASLAVSGFLRWLLAAILGRKAAERPFLHVAARRRRLAERSLLVGGHAEGCRQAERHQRDR
jgi:hypothetical protein